MSEAANPAIEPTLEILWQEDASAYVLVREPDGTLSSRGLHEGMPAVAELVHAGHGVGARRLELPELLELAGDARTAIAPGGTARVVFAVIEVARRSVAAGLVHPHLEAADGRWHALWGATLDEHVVDELEALAHAAPAAAADAFAGDTRAFVHDLYACTVDELARRALRDAGVTLTTVSSRSAAVAERFLAGLAAPTPELPADSGYFALERRVAAWVDGGLARRSRAPWNLGLRLDETDVPGSGDAPSVVLELWLEAADDPTLALPAALLESGADEVFGFLRDSDPRRALDRRLETVEPILAEAGIALYGDPPTHVALDADQVRAFLRDVDAAARGGRRPSAAAARVGLLVQPHPGQPRRERPGRGVERAADPRRDRVVRLASRDRRCRAERGRAARAGRGEGAAHPAPRQVACAPR